MKTPIDLIIEARWIIPIEPAGIVLENHAIAIDRGRIVAVLQHPEAHALYNPREVVKRPRHILIPGLVNLHTHATTALLGGLIDHPPSPPGGPPTPMTDPSRSLTPQLVHDATRLACARMLRSGITCFNEFGYFPRSAARAALESGMRAVIGLLCVDFPTPYATDADDYLTRGLAVRDELRDEALLGFCLAPYSPTALGDRGLARVLTLAEQCELPIHLHLHETKAEISEHQKRYGIRPVERLRRLGLLSPGLIAAHAAHLDRQEIALLATHGCSVAYCPSASYAHSGNDTALAALTRRDLAIGLGSDGAPNNARFDLFEEMRLAAHQLRAGGGVSATAGAARALLMATLGGARALGLDHKIGSIVAGKAADLCAINADTIEMSGIVDMLSAVVDRAGREHISDVWIAGRVRFADGSLCAEDEIELIKLAALWQNQICPRNV